MKTQLSGIFFDKLFSFFSKSDEERTKHTEQVNQSNIDDKSKMEFNNNVEQNRHEEKILLIKETADIAPVVIITVAVTVTACVIAKNKTTANPAAAAFPSRSSSGSTLFKM